MSELQASSNVSWIHIYGMNWMGDKSVHIDFAHPEITSLCCTKCIIHPCTSQVYNPYDNTVQILLLIVIPFFISCAVCTHVRSLPHAAHAWRSSSMVRRGRLQAALSSLTCRVKYDMSDATNAWHVVYSLQSWRRQANPTQIRALLQY